MRARLGKIARLLGRHDREHFIAASRDIVIVWCPRCQNPKAADAFDARWLLPGPTAAPPDQQRQLPESDELRTAVAMLAAVERDDPAAVLLLARYANQMQLVLALRRLVIDALAEPSSTDLAGYTQRAFARLGSPPQ